MQFNPQETRQYLKESDFEDLFTQTLGWENHSQILPVVVDETEYILTAIAQKRGMAVYECPQMTEEKPFPDYATRRKIQKQVAKVSHENFIIYTDADKSLQIWQWVKRQQGKPDACREHHYKTWQSGDSLIQKLQNIAISLDEEEEITLFGVIERVGTAFYAEKVTKKFYDRFKKEHDAFLGFLNGIPDEEMQKWYVSVMLNRLMFIYFIQKKGFLNNDIDYLQTKLRETRRNNTDIYYKEFLCPLFFEGFAKPENERDNDISDLLGTVPYLNGGIFQKHEIETLHGENIEIPDTAFEKLFDFFEQYQWHLDDRPLKNDNEINPDVLGYIFEKYINQKQMGAYYTKEDITEYISKNTIIPFLFDAARKSCKIAFEGDASVWKLLQEDPDRYIYEAVKKGVGTPLPENIAVGIDDVSQRTDWNTLAPEDYALPTEIWREVVARRQRYETVHAKLANEEVNDINDLITYNLDIRQFAQDVIENCEGPELLRAFWKAIKDVTVLDPTCGSGAFLFAALNILEPLYEACLDRMQVFVDELKLSDEKPHSRKYIDFRGELEKIKKHPNQKYFILKSIIIKNLYGVDIMEEAVEICKLRLFLKMVAQIEDVKQIEPLPDIDFNIQAGNTLVGFATDDEIENALSGRFDFDNLIEPIREKAEDIKERFTLFQKQQTKLGGVVTADDKQMLQQDIEALEDELNKYLAGIYDVDVNNQSDYQNWLDTHKPFHWFVAFYGILQEGGFDVIIGNPPYVEYNAIKHIYTVPNSELTTGGNLHSMTTYRLLPLTHGNSFLSLIVPLAFPSTDRMRDIRKTLTNYASTWISNYAIRPSKLFTGSEQRLSIFIATRHCQRKIFTTKYLKWNSEERDYLFSSLQYHKWSHRKTLRDVLPKFDIATAETIMHKVTKQGITIASCLGSTTSCRLYYKNTGIGYYI
ncbi:SAM-dependent methyltransferase, partial [Candidatus Poribacteria bacterium]|nr:SAM-dependent methyltransferase [Candidatus Poribacteria bacterium]